MTTEATLSFFNCVSTKKKATEQALINIRQFYPDSYFILACDACQSYMDLCEKYHCEYFHSMNRLGYPQQPYGYDIEGAIDWLTRFYIAALRAPTTHLMMMEDDIVITKKLTIDLSWEVAGNYVCETTLQPVSRFPPELMESIYKFSGKYPNVNYYAAGGGSIFKVSTLLEYYPEVVKWMRTEGKRIQLTVWPTIGWLDCFMAIFYFLAGKEWTYNPKLTHLYNCTDYDAAYESLKHDYEIIAHFKKYY
jgi:hypothetical protein